MNILLYSPFNQRSRDTESLMIAFAKNGHQVISLSQAEGKNIHSYLQSAGISTFSYIPKSSSTFSFFIKHIIFFIKFCWRHKVDIVYSHLESANFVAIASQYFIKANVFINRHHIDEAALRGFDQSLLYKLTYKLARKIVVVSDRGLHYMVNVEGVRQDKIVKINLAYDFKLYVASNDHEVRKIKEQASTRVVITTISRLTKFKRVDLSILILSKLRRAGLEATLYVLGTGEEEENLKKMVLSLKLDENVKFVGHVQNVMDYLVASDFILHPSLLESSCVVIKEAGIAAKPVIVCKNVGDFDEYINHLENGYIFENEESKFVTEATKVILADHSKREFLERMGRSLHRSIFSLFDIDRIFAQHIKLINYDLKRSEES